MSDWQYDDIIRKIARRARDFSKRYGDDQFNPYAQSGFIDKDTYRPLSEAEIREKYQGKQYYGYDDYFEHKVDMLDRMGARDYLRDRSEIHYENLVYLAYSTGDKDLMKHILATDKQSVIREIYEGKHNTIYAKYGNEVVSAKVHGESIQNIRTVLGSPIDRNIVPADLTEKYLAKIAEIEAKEQAEAQRAKNKR